MSSGERWFVGVVLAVGATVVLMQLVTHLRFMARWNADVEASKTRFTELDNERMLNAIREAEEMGYRRGREDERDVRKVPGYVGP